MLPLRWAVPSRGLHVWVVLALGGCGWGSSGEAASPQDAVARDESGREFGADQSRCEHEGRADREAHETAGPGAVQPNIRRVYAVASEGEEQRRVLICREVDTNFDGIKDVVRIYEDTGEPAMEAADTDFDGRMDLWMTFQDGRPGKAEEDTNGDGRPDEVRFYLSGRLRRAQRDTNFDGKADVWEIYDDGRLQRVGEDLDHDGLVDRWSRDEILAREAEAKENHEAAAPAVPAAPGANREGPSRDEGGARPAATTTTSKRESKGARANEGTGVDQKTSR